MGKSLPSFWLYWLIIFPENKNLMILHMTNLLLITNKYKI